MTKEEKIICKEFLNDADNTHSCNEYKLLMALLEQETVSKESYEHEYFLRKELDLKVTRLERQIAEQELCEDCVSRKRLMDNYNGVETPVGYRKVVDLEVIKNMPPVTPIIKPQGMLLLAKSNDTMLDVARNVIKAVETTIEVPTGLESLKFNRKQEKRNRILELIEYLKTYADWRE